MPGEAPGAASGLERFTAWLGLLWGGSAGIAPPAAPPYSAPPQADKTPFCSILCSPGKGSIAVGELLYAINTRPYGSACVQVRAPRGLAMA